MLGALLAFASAAFFGLNTATVRRGVLKATVLQGMAITVPVGVPLFAILVYFTDGFSTLAQWQNSTWWWMAMAGIVHFVIGRYGNYRSTQALGATLSTPIQQLSILVALFTALVFLDETLSGMNILGIALVLFGPMVVIKRKGKTKVKAPNASRETKPLAAAGAAGAPVKLSPKIIFEPRYASGFFWGIIGAIGYGVSPLLIVYGIGKDGGIKASISGIFVSYTAATLVVIVIIILAGGRKYMANFDRNSQFWFWLSAIFVAISQLFRYMALAFAPVSVVVPIQRLSAVFRIVFSGLINREHEVLDTWVIIAIFVSIAGSIALALDTSYLLELLSLPEFLNTILAWKLN